MTEAKPAGLPAKESTRPAYGSWAPGDYMCQCVGCRSIFSGDKRALHCADCAYALPDTKAALLAAEARVRVLREALRALLDGCIALDGEEAILPMQMSKARAALKEPAND